MEKSQRGVGIDFGTTNSAVAVAIGQDVQIAHFESSAGLVDTFRSVLYFERKSKLGARKHEPLAGPAAIARYLSDEDRGRLVQSLKSFLASRLFTQTAIGQRRYALDELIAHILKELRRESEKQLGPLGTRVVVGRPVRFVGAETEADDKLALQRLSAAFTEAGFTDIAFEYEPAGAAYHYESTLDHDELILIADFGGGTSDFSVLPVGPQARRERGIRKKPLSTAGVGLAGDAFDAKIIRHLISPLLGAGTSYRSMDKVLPIPSSLFLRLERWHHLSFLKSQETMNMLRSLRAEAFEPDMIEKLVALVDNDLGFYLHRAVQRTKVELSAREETVFEFEQAGLHIRQPVRRSEFESWIAGELGQIRDTVEEALRRASVKADRIDQVFLTGGSSLVPAVRRIFDERFTAERVRTGDEFTSVARGLALRAAGG